MHLTDDTEDVSLTDWKQHHTIMPMVISCQLSAGHEDDKSLIFQSLCSLTWSIKIKYILGEKPSNFLSGRLPLRGKTIYLFIRPPHRYAAFTTLLRLDASFAMASRALQLCHPATPDAAPILGPKSANLPSSMSMRVRPPQSFETFKSFVLPQHGKSTWNCHRLPPWLDRCLSSSSSPSMYVQHVDRQSNQHTCCFSESIFPLVATAAMLFSMLVKRI